jgi:hypothetical protein
MRHKIFYQTKILPFFLIICSLIFAGSVSAALAPKPQVKSILVQKTQTLVTPTPTNAPTVTPFLPTTTPTKGVIVVISATPTPQVAKQDKQSLSPAPNATATPLPTSSPTPTIVVQTVTLEIKTPDGADKFNVSLTPNATVCDILEAAKNEGKINSLTLDDSYMDTLHSKYVY